MGATSCDPGAHISKRAQLPVTGTAIIKTARVAKVLVVYAIARIVGAGFAAVPLSGFQAIIRTLKRRIPRRSGDVPHDASDSSDRHEEIPEA